MSLVQATGVTGHMHRLELGQILPAHDMMSSLLTGVLQMVTNLQIPRVGTIIVVDLFGCPFSILVPICFFIF